MARVEGLKEWEVHKVTCINTLSVLFHFAHVLSDACDRKKYNFLILKKIST